MDLDKVKEIAEELLQDEAFVRTMFIQGTSYETKDPDPVVKAILVGCVYIAQVVADRLDGVAEDKESHDHTTLIYESDLSRVFDSVLNLCEKELQEARRDSDKHNRKERMDNAHRCLKIAGDITPGSLKQKNRYGEVQVSFWQLVKAYGLIESDYLL